MLTAQPIELIINGVKYSVEVSMYNEIILKRYRTDYKMWVAVSYSSNANETIEENIKHLLKNQFINQIKNDLVTN